MLGIKAYILSAVVVGCLSFGGLYIVKQYFHMRATMKIMSQQLTLNEHYREATARALVEVENDINKNFKLQREALLEMDKQGYLSFSDGNSGRWMFDFQTQSN